MLCGFSAQREQITFTGRSSELTGAGYRSLAVTGILCCILWCKALLHRYHTICVNTLFICRGEQCSPVSFAHMVCINSNLATPRNGTSRAPSPTPEFYCRKIPLLGVGFKTRCGYVIPHSSLLIPHSACILSTHICIY